MQEDVCGVHEKHKPMRDVVERGSILLYSVELTPTGRISGTSKQLLVNALKPFSELYKLLPKTWIPACKKAKTRKSRKR